MLRQSASNDGCDDVFMQRYGEQRSKISSLAPADSIQILRLSWADCASGLRVEVHGDVRSRPDGDGDGAGDEDDDGEGIESGTVQGQIDLGVRLVPRPGWLPAFAALQLASLLCRTPNIETSQHRSSLRGLYSVIRNAVEPTGT